MASSILLSDNGVSSGSAGIKTSGGNDGVLLLQTTTAGGSATTAVTVDNAQNVGVGVTPSAWGSSTKAIQVQGLSLWGDTGNLAMHLSQNVYDTGSYRYRQNGVATDYVQYNGAHSWYYAASGTAGNTISFTQAMTLDSSGNLLVGTTSPAVGSSKMYVQASSNGITSRTSATNYNAINNAGSGCTFIYFQSDTVEMGAIRQNGSSAVSYNTTSDYRLKENAQPMVGALATVAALKPCTYTWKIDGSSGQGFIAHELQEVVPDCVTGEKDAVDADGNPQYQGIDTSFLVATLTAAIQEQQQIITTLTQRVEALEGAKA